MRPRHHIRLRLFLVFSAVVSLTALAAGSVFAQPSLPSSRSGPQVTASFQPATAPVVIHTMRDMHAAASAAAAAPRAGSTAKQVPLRTPLGADAYARVKRAAKQSAPRSTFVGDPPDARGVASFAGLQSSASVCPPIGCNPPDMGLAASSTWVLQGANTSYTVLDHNGATQPGFPKTFDEFFGIPAPTGCSAAGEPPFTSDPRALYDPQDDRFIAAALEVEGAFGVNDCAFATRYWIAVSQTNDPRGVWNVYAFDMSRGTTNAADFTMIGLDERGIYFSANVFNQAGDAYEYAEIFGADKSRMERGLDVTGRGFYNLQVSGPSGTTLMDTVQPVLTIPQGRGPDAEYFVDTFNGFDPVSGHTCTSAADACVGLATWAFTWTGGTPSLGFAYVPNTRAYTFAPAADQTTCRECIDSSDLRISATPIYRGGRIYAAWESGVNNGTQVVPGIVWSVVNPQFANGLRSATQVRGDYYNFGGDDAVVYPALMPAQGNSTIYMVFDRMGATTNPEVRVTALRGNHNFQVPGALVKAGEAPYRPTRCGVDIPVCRWGDYSASSLDERGTTWFAGEYANASGFRTNWGTWIVGFPG